eukprot:TRINITY_DN10857_c0_g2_i6.p1 TRINITY_DN10857_c0_g2~~TRINITY_DN10857_c0_g2_i6.p1  ORF type:complete len:132 (-),score=19.08 TRINITY_DN10857_c0_g2_i6:76-471(-)
MKSVHLMLVIIKYYIKMQIFIRTSEGKTITLDVEPGYTIDTIKYFPHTSRNKIKDHLNIEPHMQNITKAKSSKILEGSKSLADYDIGNEATLWVNMEGVICCYRGSAAEKAGAVRCCEGKVAIMLKLMVST